ncbi:MAG: hypothetical protein FJX75_24530 [Armatimonadetes bacterium]|nr:hypothetical protein [Armatimonadota bacterium]
MNERQARTRRILGIARAAIGPPILLVIAATQGVRVTGVATVALAHPPPGWRLAVADVLVALALGTIAFWAAAALVGKRGVLAHFMLPVATAQLPLAGVALAVGRRILAATVAHAVSGQGEDELLKNPAAALSGLLPTVVVTLLLTILVVGVLYTAYRRVTGLTGWRLPVSFAGGLLAAEVVCRLWAWWAA